MGTELTPGLVSLIVPTRDSARTIRACLKSIRTQTGADVELIVVDNHSQDGTDRVAEELAHELVVQGPERSAQRNVGARRSKGEFVVFVDSDMTLPPTVAREVVEAFRADPAVDALVLPELSVGEGYWTRCRQLEKRLYVGDPSVEAARAFRRHAFDAVGGYDESLHAGEDWDLPDRIAARGGQIGRIAATVYHDEGRLMLRRTVAKKLYYGRALTRYASKDRGVAARRFSRVGVLRRLPLAVLRNPRHGTGLVVLKSLEVVAALTGMALSARARRAGA